MELREFAEPDVGSQSKDRTPTVFWFNPFTEGFLAEGKAYNPGKPQAQLAADLENLPQFLGRRDDLVLVRRKPPVEFLSRIKQAGFALPEFVELGEPEARRQTAGAPAAFPKLAGRKLGRLRPWGWGPDSVELLEPLFEQVTGEKRTGAQRFNPRLAELYSKAWSADFLRAILPRSGPTGAAADSTRPAVFSRLCTANEAGLAVHNLAEAMAAISIIRGRGQHPLVVKQAFGAAGRNALRWFEPEPRATQLRWLARVFARHQAVVIEPWLARLHDFSVQLEMTPAGLKLCGFTGLINDARGQFMANYAESHHHQRLPSRVIAAFGEPGKNLSGQLLEFYEEVFARLEAELRDRDFTGPIGIDALVYRDAGGQARLKPVVEINPRYTMGRVLVELMRQTSQNSAGVFRLVNAAQARAQGFANLAACARAWEMRFPLQWEGGPVRLREGALCLNDAAAARTCLALFQVGRTLDALLPADPPDA